MDSYRGGPIQDDGDASGRVVRSHLFRALCEDQSANIYRRPDDGTLEKLPRGAKPVGASQQHLLSYRRRRQLRIRFFATADGDLIVVQADGVAPIA
jgi:hypothetical protein